jgi:hypothetical protein
VELRPILIVAIHRGTKEIQTHLFRRPRAPAVVIAAELDTVDPTFMSSTRAGGRSGDASSAGGRSGDAWLIPEQVTMRAATLLPAETTTDRPDAPPLMPSDYEPGQKAPDGLQLPSGPAPLASRPIGCEPA